MSRNLKRNNAFTLIELAAVLLVMALLAGAAVLALAHTINPRTLEDIYDQVARSDALVRSAARQAGSKQWIIYDLDDHTMQWQTATDQKPMMLMHCGTDSEMEVQTSTQNFFSGQVTIEYSARGYTPSYAVGIQRPNESKRWMIFAGITGGLLRTGDEKRVEAVMQSLSSDRPVKGQDLNDNADSTNDDAP